MVPLLSDQANGGKSCLQAILSRGSYLMLLYVGINTSILANAPSLRTPHHRIVGLSLRFGEEAC